MNANRSNRPGGRRWTSSHCSTTWTSSPSRSNRSGQGNRILFSRLERLTASGLDAAATVGGGRTRRTGRSARPTSPVLQEPRMVHPAHSVTTHFQDLPDPRSPLGRRHVLSDLLAIAILAVI